MLLEVNSSLDIEPQPATASPVPDNTKTARAFIKSLHPQPQPDDTRYRH